MTLKRKDYIEELKPNEKIIGVGTKKDGWAKKVQEWLNLHRYHTPLFNLRVDIDDWFGEATAEAVKEFQRIKKLEITGQVDLTTWLSLVSPMRRAYRDATSLGLPVKEALVMYMVQFCDEHPTEIHPNLGPWVRSFMKGHEGSNYAWCNGVVSTALDHACVSLGIEMKDVMTWSWSCESTKRSSIEDSTPSTYYSPEQIANGEVTPERGDLFLVIRKSDNRARHIGVIENVNGSVASTIEGNTNDEGSREGYELCKRKRNLSNGNYGIIKLK
jgi:hypothetical protein